MSSAWSVVPSRNAETVVAALPTPIRLRILEALRKLEAPLYREGHAPLAAHHPTLRAVQPSEGWHVVYVVLPSLHAVFVSEVVHGSSDALRKERARRALQRARTWSRQQRKRRNPADLDARVRTVLAAHPEWGDTRVARAANCSPNAVRTRRVAWGCKSGITLPWLHEA